MNEWTEEEMEEAVILAETLVRRELRLKENEEAQAPDLILNKDRNLVSRGKLEVASNPLAQKILPQARLRLRMRYDREKALLKSVLLGKIKKAAADMIISGKMVPLDRAPELHQEVWEKFSLAVKGAGGNRRDARKVMSRLVDMLEVIITELITTEIPPVEPQYVIPKK